MFYFFNHIDFGQSCQYSYLFFLKFQIFYTCTCSASAIIKTGQQSTDSCPDKSKKSNWT